jgi:selenocysteine lyase/cysteine desulfurase
MRGAAGLAMLVGDGLSVPCVDGAERRFVDFDAAASTSALPAVAERVAAFLPFYSSVHRGAGYKSQLATAEFERAREEIRSFAGREGTDDAVIFCRNTTEAINHLAYRLRLERSDVVVTTAVEHHANLLPWRRAAKLRVVECGREGIFDAATVVAEIDRRPRLLAITGGSNVTGWMPPLDPIIASAHERGVPVAVDAAQLAPHRPLPVDADFLAFSGHKMYAPFGAGALIGPRTAFTDGDPFLVGGGAVADVSLERVVWRAPPEREEAGSPNVIGALAFAAAARELAALGRPRIAAHDAGLAHALRAGLSSIPGVRLLGPGLETETLPIACFVIDEVPHSLVAARLSAEFAIGVRHGRFCAHPYLARLLGRGGAVRASAGVGTTAADVERLLEAVAVIAGGSPPPVEYRAEPGTGEYWPTGFPRPAAG